ncbi:CD99 molecule isoform 3-T3 [Polymixia lowei]
MKFCLRIALLLFLLTGTNAQELDLLDAFGDDPTPAAPKTPKAPEKPKADGDGFDLLDALGPDTEPKKPQKPAPGDTGDLDILDGLDFGPTKAPPPKPVDPKKPAGGDDFGFDLADALGPDSDPKPDKPAVNPPKSGEGGGTFDDSDLFGVGEGDYKPDPAKPGSGGRAQDPGYDANGGDNAPTQDLDLLWGQFVKMLNAKMPEEVYMWISNMKQMLAPLLKRAMELLEAVQ